eukprot:65680-Alexandrium_andersonii.AAC.1
MSFGTAPNIGKAFGGVLGTYFDRGGVAGIDAKSSGGVRGATGRPNPRPRRCVWGLLGRRPTSGT